ncbi:UNVERIFIED_CONTAM: hypothetical protein Slati_1563900 [Sesamum latifolium]|uniref:Bet v I/Major latex protein domain-containing protein n=1 Tax=Sesamum latifolium TaxID=2727402 RepID=A0AAW2XDT9_9LAMI
MDQLEKVEASTQISSSADKFYSFFRNDMNQLLTIIPDIIQTVELIQGEEGSVGAAKRWKFLLGGISLSMDMETLALDDDARSITFKAIDGDVLLLYKTYQFTIAVSDGLVHWTILYEKAFMTALLHMLMLPLRSWFLSCWTFTFSPTKEDEQITEDRNIEEINFFEIIVELNKLILFTTYFLTRVYVTSVIGDISFRW